MVGTWVGLEGCYTGYHPVTLQDPYLVYSEAQGPTYGQMKLILEVLMRFPS